MVKVLQTHGGSMLLETDAAGWCQVFVRTGQKQVRLGADRSNIVEARLAAGLADELTGPITGSIDGSEVRWVLSLAEHHGTIYMADQGEIRRLFFEDSKGALLGKLDLLEHERREWVVTLRGPDRG